MKAEVLLGQSYFLRFDAKLWRAMQPYPPLGTLYAASCLRRSGYTVALFDAMLAETEAEWAEKLAQVRPEFAVLYEDNFNYLSKMCLLRMRQAAFTMIAMARRQGCRVIAAGADASDHPELYLAQGADFVVSGEGEQTLVELLDHLSGRSRAGLKDITGLVFPTAGQPAYRTPPRPPRRDLDALPFPAWDLVDVERYRRTWRERHGYFSMNMVTTRGCPYHCNWCAKPIWGQRYNVRSPENVAAELRWLQANYAPDHIWFADDILGLKPGWLAGFAGCIEAGGEPVPFKGLSRVDLLLREGDVDALRRAGAHTIWVGAESGSQKILDAMEKGTRVEQIYAATERLHAAGIRTGFFLQFGYPGETRDDIERTLEMVRRCNPDDIGMSVSYPLPGTPFYERVRAQLGERRNWVDSADLAMLYASPFSTAFYRQLHRVLHKTFRFRQWRRGRIKRAAGRGAWYDLARGLYDGLTLPLERLRLSWLARRSPSSLSALPVGLDPEAAARPTSQEGEGSER